MSYNSCIKSLEVMLLGERKVPLYINRNNDHIEKTIKTTGDFYEKELLLYLSTMLTPECVVIDVGAHIGNHSVFLAEICGATVIAIEPSLENYEILAINSRRILPKGLIRCERAVVSHMSGLNYSGSVDCTNRGATRFSPATSSESVISVTIDEVGRGQPVKLIKIDVEGMELDVLRGALKTIDVFRPILAIETQAVAQFESVISLLASYDYVAVARFCYTPTVVFRHSGRFPHAASGLQRFSCNLVRRGLSTWVRK